MAATTAIREIRKRDESVEMEVFTDDRHPYYPKPNLIDFIGGSKDEKEVIQYDFEWYESQGVVLHKSKPITRIHTGDLTLECLGHKHEGFDRLLIAVGSHPFVPPIQGAAKKGVHVLHSLDDARDIKEAVEGAGREIIVGGGILGIELAAAIRRIGGEPIVVTNVDTLLPLQLDAGASGVLLQRLKQTGIDVLLNFTCEKIVGDIHVAGVVSSAGDTVEGDLVSIATGVLPNIHLAKISGIATNRGVTADDHMETSARRVYAAGDCMEWNGEWHGIIPWALASARVAAQNMLEYGRTTYQGITPSNTLQVAGIDLTSIGIFRPESPEYESIVSIDREKGTYYKVVVKDQKIVGGIALGNRKVAMKLRRLIADQTDVSDSHQEIFEVT